VTSLGVRQSDAFLFKPLFYNMAGTRAL